MNKATLAGVWPSEMPEWDTEVEESDITKGDAIIDRVLDTMSRDVTSIVTEHALGRISDESFRLLMDYLSKYDAMLRGEL